MNNMELDNQVKLMVVASDEQFDTAISIMENDDLFKNELLRLYLSEYSALLKVNGEVIGLINLVLESHDRRFLFLDMIIKKEYQGKGYGKQALEKIANLGIKPFIIAKTSEDNIPATKTIEEVGAFITQINDKNIYLLQKDRIDEFLSIDNDYVEAINDHYTNKKKAYLQQ